MAIENAASTGSAILADILGSAARRFTEDLADRGIAEGMTVLAGGRVEGSAAALLPRVGEVVVVVEQRLRVGPAEAERGDASPPDGGGAVEGTLFALVSAPDAALLAAVVVGASPEERRGEGFQAERDLQPVAGLLASFLRTAAGVLADALGRLSADEPSQPKVFALQQELNRAVGFLGEGELSGITLKLVPRGEEKGGESGGAVVWLLARPIIVRLCETLSPPSSSTGRTTDPQLHLQHLLRISVPIIVSLAEKKMTVGEILGLAEGQVIVFDKSCDEFLDLLVNNQRIGRGEAVKVGDRFGLRIVEIGDVRDTIRKLGPPSSPPAG